MELGETARGTAAKIQEMTAAGVNGLYWVWLQDGPYLFLPLVLVSGDGTAPSIYQVLA